MLHKILSMLDRRERWTLALLLVLATVSGLAQVAGVGSVLPLLSVLTDPGVIQENTYLRWMHDQLGAPGTNAFLVMLGAGVLAAFVLSNAMIAFTQWYTFKFARWNNYRLSRRLLEAYLRKPYIYHTQHNSVDAGRNVLVEAQIFTGQLVIPGIQAVAFGVTALFLIGFLARLSPVAAALSVGVVGGGYAFVYLALRSHLRRVGSWRLRANAGSYRAVSEAFGAIKEVKASGREIAFLQQYEPEAKRLAQAMAAHQVLTQLPRYVIEVVGIGGILLVLMLLIAAGQGTTAVLPVVGVYTIAAFRLLPALQQVYVGVSQLRAGMPVVESLHADLFDPMDAPADALVLPDDGHARFPFRENIELRDVSFSYPGRNAPALQDVRLTIPRRSSIALMGETGAGKTTLADIILGLLRPQQGDLRVDGVRLDDDNLRYWRREIGYVSQHIYLSDATVASNIAFGIPYGGIDRVRVEQAARIANIHDFIVDHLPAGYDTVVGERGVRLSGGQRQRIGIARALYHDPEVLVLDEATSALDNATEAAVQAAIKQVAEAKTLIIIAHRLSTVRDCDLVCLLENGRVAAFGSYDSVVDERSVRAPVRAATRS